MDYDYDLLVIGSGPAGQRAAIQAAKVQKRVAIIERKLALGGACYNTGTIPSKTLREAVLYFSGYRERGLYGASYAVKANATMEDLLFRADHVIRHEIDVIRHQLVRNRVEILTAEASFIDDHTLRLAYPGEHAHRELTAANIVIASGTEQLRDPNVPFDVQTIFGSDDIVHLKDVPRTLAVVGAGVIGCEYASIFAALGVRVTLIDKRTRLLPFIDSEMADALVYHLNENRVTLRLGEEVKSVEPVEDELGSRVRINLASGKHIGAEKALYSIGRQGATASLNLEAAGVNTDKHGRVAVNQNYQTEVPNIYAAGDVVGFPNLASTSMEQGSLAPFHALGIAVNSAPELFPYGIYTIPEISFVGRTEEELTADGISYEIGKARYKEIARGQIMGDSTGLLKLIFHYETRELLGVHVIGDGASELVHIGQAVLTFGGKVDYFVNTVFNFPTLAECYKTAAFDGINRLT